MGSSGQAYYSPHHYAAAAAVHAATSGVSNSNCGGSGGGQSGGDGGHNLETTAAAAAAAYGYGCHQWMGRSGETSAAAAALPGNNNNVEVTGGASTSAANSSTSAGVKMDISAMSAWAAALQQPEYKDYNGYDVYLIPSCQYCQKEIENFPAYLGMQPCISQWHHHRR